MNVVLAVALVWFGGSTAQAQAVRVTHGSHEVASEGDFDALPETVEGLDNPLRAPSRVDDRLDLGTRAALEIGAAVGTTALLGSVAYLVALSHESSCPPEGCELDSRFLSLSIGAALATGLVPLAIVLTGSAAGEDGGYGDTLLGYLTGLVVGLVFSSMGANPGGDAFLYPAIILATIFPIAGSILAYEASSMESVGSRGPTGQRLVF